MLFKDKGISKMSKFGIFSVHLKQILQVLPEVCVVLEVDFGSPDDIFPVSVYTYIYICIYHGPPKPTCLEVFYVK